MIMSKAATRIQTKVRAKQARKRCLRLRKQREEQKMQAERAANERMEKSVIRIQSHARRKAATKFTSARRAQLAKELEGDRAEADRAGGHKDHAGESGRRAPANRR